MKNFFTKLRNYIKNRILPIFTEIQWSEIPVATYVRWSLVFIITINSILTMFNCNPIPYSEEGIYMIVSYTLNIIILIVNTYKNNSTSKEALIMDQLMRALKIAAFSDKETILEKLKEILKELNGEDYIPIGEDQQKSETEPEVKPEPETENIDVDKVEEAGLTIVVKTKKPKSKKSKK